MMESLFDDQPIRLQPGERIRVAGDVLRFDLTGGARTHGADLEFIVPSRRGQMIVQGFAETHGELSFTSSLGSQITRTVVPGINTFVFLIEPQPDDWYCENDRGNPPHPVSKGDITCRKCGGRILQG